MEEPFFIPVCESFSAWELQAVFRLWICCQTSLVSSPLLYGMVDGVEDVSLIQAPKRRQKQIGGTVSGKPVYDDIG